MPQFQAILEIIGINPFVFVPEKALKQVFLQAGKDKGPIPIKGILNGKAYTQSLVRYKGHWRLYVNTLMLKDSPKRIGEKIRLSVKFDPAERSIPMHPEFEKALAAAPKALKSLNALIPSRRKEILRYIANLKSDESRKKNIERAIQHLLGKRNFAGRD